MKSVNFLVLFAAALFAFSNVYANGGLEKTAAVSEEVIVENLINGVNSENTGLKVSAAYLLGDYGSSDAVIPLMRMFNGADDDGVKIAAALALTKIGDPRGLDLIGYASNYDESEHVRKMCRKFYAHALTAK